MKSDRPIRAYFLSLTVLGSAVLLRLLLHPWLGDQMRFATVFGAIATATWLGGVRPAILTALLGYLACDWMFVAPSGHLGFPHIQNVLGFLTYFVSSATIILFGHRLQQANHRRQAAVAKFESIFHQSGIFAGIMDVHGRLLEANGLSLKACGYRREEVLDRPFWETPWWRNSTEVQQKIRAATREASAGRIYREVLPYWRADGTERTVEFAMLPIRDESGAVTMLHPTGIDITERKQVEAALQKSERKHRIVADNTYDFEFWRDPRGDFIYVSPSYERITGCEPAALLQDSQLLLRLIHPDDRAHFEKEVLTGAHSSVEFEYRIVRPDGSLRWVAQVSQPVHDEDGTYLGVRGSVRDVTDRCLMREALRQAKESAETANHAKDRFIAALSHELRTPLMPVLITAQMREDATDLPDEVRADFAMIRENIQLEALLLDDLLDSARIAQGKMRCERTTCDMHLLIEKAVATSRPEFDSREIKLEVKREAQNSIVEGDCLRLQQVIWNLLRNAAKFSPSGKRVTIRTSDNYGQLHVSVADEGIGIAGEDLTRIFAAFEQTEAGARHKGGLGLGLSISKFIVAAHSGRIWAESDGEGRGSTFHIELPVSARQHRAVVSKPNGSTNGQDLPLRILLVEDDTSSRTILARLLRKRGHDVCPTETIAAARDAASGRTFDLVISDLGLPDGDGYEMMRELREAYKLRGIALSGYGTDDDVRRSREAGYSAHLIKPVSVDSLTSALRDASGCHHSAG